jgi:hypothetical protein
LSRSRHHLTPAVEQAIVAYIRAGGFPHVAAEAAGVPREVFEQWRQRGEEARAPKRYRSFADAVRQAAAQARLRAEVTIHDEKPLDWLRYGPGRETADAPGWTAAVRPRPLTRDESLLLNPLVQALFTTVLDALGAFPEARITVARALESGAFAAPAI